MRIATQEDDELAPCKHAIMHGWPGTIREVPSEIQPYWTFREKLTIEDGIVLKGTWIVVAHKKYQATDVYLFATTTIYKCLFIINNI